MPFGNTPVSGKFLLICRTSRIMFRAMSFRGFASDSNGRPAPWQYEQSTLSEFRNSCITPPPCTCVSGGSTFRFTPGVMREAALQRFTAVVELLRRFRLGLDASAMARRAVHLVVTRREHTGAARKAPIDLPHHGDHPAGDVLLRIGIARKVALDVAVGALHSERLIEDLHGERHVRIRRKDFQVLERGRRRAASASCGLLRHGPGLKATIRESRIASVASSLVNTRQAAGFS